MTKVEAKDVPVEVRALVELRPLAQADVWSKTLGYLDAVLVDRGDAVKRNQLVALVRASDLPDQLVTARGTLGQVQSSAELARKNLDRVTALAPRGVVSQQELQQAEAAVASAEAQEAAAKAQVGVYAQRLGETKITSPLDGVVAVRRLDPGALVGPSASPILTIARIDVLRVFFPVIEREAHLVNVGQKAHVEVDALPGKSIEGTVVRVAPAVDPATRTLDAEVQIENKEGLLRPGMFGRGALVVEVHPKAPVIPATVLQVTDQKRFVFVLGPGDKVQRREIETGVDEGTWLEVKKGLAPGDEIVSIGMDAISDGVLVRVNREVDPYRGRVDGGAAKPN